jgi:hypothetical protein
VKCGLRVALGVAGGYFLGRTKKMKLAMMLAGMAAGRQAGGPGELLKGGTKLLASRPELARLTDEVRGRLLEAGKAAAVAAATRQVENLTDRVGKRVEALGDLGAGGRRRAEELIPEELAPEERAEDERAEDERAEDERAEDEYAEEPAEREPADVSEEREEPAARRPTRTPAAKSPRGRGDGRSTSATATVRRTASGAAGKTAAGRKPRARRGDGDD